MKLKIMSLALVVVTSVLLTGCGAMGGVPGPSGSQEFLKGNDTQVLTLGSLVSVSGDTYNITESDNAAIGYKAPVVTTTKAVKQSTGVYR